MHTVFHCVRLPCRHAPAKPIPFFNLRAKYNLVSTTPYKTPDIISFILEFIEIEYPQVLRDMTIEVYQS